jgi:hypothetical protein
MNTFQRVLGVVGGVIVTIPAIAMAGVIATSFFHVHLSLLTRVVAFVLFAIAAWLTARKVGWRNLLGWAWSLFIGLSALIIVAFLVVLILGAR